VGDGADGVFGGDRLGQQAGRFEQDPNQAPLLGPVDAVPLPGDISLHDLENIIADMASLAVKWHKPLSARLLPVTGKKAGEMTEFGSPYLVNIKIH